MSEEEIIKILENTIKTGLAGQWAYSTIEKAIKELLDLYNKEKEKNLKLREVISNLNNNWVSKHEIREKIKELEQDVKDFEEYWSKDPRKFKKEKCIDYYKLEALKELLGENDKKQL